MVPSSSAIHCPARGRRLKPALWAPLRDGFASLDPAATRKESAPARKTGKTSTAASIRVLTCGGVRNPGSIGAAGWLRALRHALTGSRDPRAAPGPGCTEPPGLTRDL